MAIQFSIPDIIKKAKNGTNTDQIRRQRTQFGNFPLRPSTSSAQVTGPKSSWAEVGSYCKLSIISSQYQFGPILLGNQSWAKVVLGRNDTFS